MTSVRQSRPHGTEGRPPPPPCQHGLSSAESGPPSPPVLTAPRRAVPQGDDDLDLEAGSPSAEDGAGEPVTSQPQAVFAMPPPPSAANQSTTGAPHQSSNPNNPFAMPAPAPTPATESTGLKSSEQTTYTPGECL